MDQRQILSSEPLDEAPLLLRTTPGENVVPRGHMSWFRPLMAIVFVGALSLSCRPRPGESPHSALTAYTKAIEEDRLEDAYQLLSVESRANLSLEEFKKLVADNPEEVKALLKAASKEEHPPLIRAEFETESGQILTLIYEDGEWRIDPSAINLYDQTEPRAALSSFVRAYDKKRYDILLSFVPESQKEGLSPKVLKEAWEGEQRIEIEQAVEGLRAHLATSPIEVVGERATMSFGAGGVVELVVEKGLWKIEDMK